MDPNNDPPQQQQPPPSQQPSQPSPPQQQQVYDQATEPVVPRQRKKPKVKESIIDHTYRDYSQVEVSSDDDAPTPGGDPNKKTTRLQPNFPAKLHAIVSNPNYQHIICWQPHGRSWKIVDKHLLSTVICPKHFAHAKFESFNRSVNGWGFKVCLLMFT